MSDPATYNWPNNVQGDTFPSKKFGPITNSSGPIDLSGVSIRMHIRNRKTHAGSGEIVRQLKTPEIVIGGDDNNYFTLPTFTIEKPGTYNYSIELTFGEIVKTWIKGTISIVADATNG